MYPNVNANYVVRHARESTAQAAVILTYRAGIRERDERLQQMLSGLKDALDGSDGFFYGCVVDDGSPLEVQKQLADDCRLLGLDLITLDTQGKMFSNSRNRNIGAMMVASDYVLFQDLDLVPCVDFYARVKTEMSLRQLDIDETALLMFGVVYLTAKGTELLDKSERVRGEEVLYDAYMRGDSDLIEKSSTGTSAVVVGRRYFLARGGSSMDFEGWGYEDIECNLRLCRRTGWFPLPRDYCHEEGSMASQVKYQGWKSYYRLFGDMTFAKRLFYFHRWHEVEENSEYQQIKERNRGIFLKKIAEHHVDGTEPDPLPDLNAGTTLILNKANAFTCPREVRPRFGRLIERSEDSFKSGPELLNSLKELEVDRLVFFNPYASKKRLALYRAVRKAGFPYLVAERGALRDSLFFDPHGFNADSKSYEPKYWDKPISDEAAREVEGFAKAELQSSHSLEDQGDRLGVDGLRQALSIPLEKKILFVPLQRPSDTVMEFMAKSIGGASGFNDLLRHVHSQLPHDWVMLVKKHPLETERPNLPDDVFVPDDTHINDLLQLSSAVLAVNSGVGVLALLANLPMMYAGECFYGHRGLNSHVKTADCVVSFLKSPKKPDPTKRLRFLAYLIFEFYSFGTMKTRRVQWHDGSWMTATTQIDLYQMRGIGRAANYGVGTQRISLESPLFDRYRNDLDDQERKNRVGYREAPRHGGGSERSGVTQGMRRVQRQLKDARFMPDPLYQGLNAAGKLAHHVLTKRSMFTPELLRELMKYDRT